MGEEKFPSFQEVGKGNSFTFEKFLTEKGISPEDERVPIIKEAWNKALEAASLYFSGLEGTDYNVEDALGVE
jgi:hypothetical protein